MKPNYAYEKDAAAIYRRSFAVIRGEADLARFSAIEERVAVRVISLNKLCPWGRTLAADESTGTGRRATIRCYRDGPPARGTMTGIPMGDRKARQPTPRQILYQVLRQALHQAPGAIRPAHGDAVSAVSSEHRLALRKRVKTIN